MDAFESISHTKWECKYHVIFVPKFRRKAPYGQLRDAFWRIVAQVSNTEGKPD